VGAHGPYIVCLRVSRQRRQASLLVVAHAEINCKELTVRPLCTLTPLSAKNVQVNLSHVLVAVGIVFDDVPPALREDAACGSCKICALPQHLHLGESANMWLDDDVSVSPSRSGVASRQS